MSFGINLFWFHINLRRHFQIKLQQITVSACSWDLRKLVRQILEETGYRVLEAANGDEAVGVIKEHRAEIDLVLTDVVMPRVSGPELIARLRETRPESRVLYMSGYTDRTVPLEQDAGAAFIQKPFTPSQLGQKLREKLNPQNPQ